MGTLAGQDSDVGTESHDLAGRGDPELSRIESLTRWSLDVALGLAAGAAALALLRVGPGARAVGLLVLAAHTAAGIRLTRGYVAGSAVPRAAETAYGVLGLGLSVFFVLATPPEPSGSDALIATVVGVLLVGTTAFVLLIRQGGRTGAALAVAAAAVAAPGYAVGGRPAAAIAAYAVLHGGCTGMMAALGRMTRWTLEAARGLTAGRDAHARLAVAEERLRFARDLHDTAGRTLSAVAVKSELSAELVRVDPDRAAREMLAVRDLAEATMTSMATLVSGYRDIDLSAEVVGAQTVLASAGVAVEVRGLGEVVAQLGPAQAEALAWAVREAATNVLRHGGTARTAIDFALSASGEAVVLRVENDVAPGRARVGGGAGLAGLAERLASVGGGVRTQRLDGSFVLEAQVPIRSQRSVRS